MTARPPLPPESPSPLTPEHARQFETLLETLNADEALWISGFLAALARQPAVPPAAASVAEASPLMILYASETGHGEALARRAEELAQAAGLAPRRLDVEEFSPAELRATRRLLLISSTHGEGEPPQPALDFYDFLHSRKAPPLPELKFAVLGLGDSSYDNFCQAAKDFDRRLEALGAERLAPRLDCDVDFEAPAAAWLASTLAAFAALPVGGTGSASGPASQLAAASGPAVQLPAAPRLALPTSQRPARVEATIVASVVLNGRGSAKETRHLELALADPGLAWEPGDSLRVFPENEPALVEELVSRLGLAGTVRVGDRAIAVAEALRRHFEITTLTPGFLAGYAELAAAPRLRALCAAAAGEAKPASQADAKATRALRRYLAERQIIDVVAEYPLTGLAAADFAALLRPLQPRLYSLASSARANPGEAHLTVAVLRYPQRGRLRRGVASCYLAERRRVDDRLTVEVASNKNFRLPADPSMPLIMIGPGTGVAPFRAFLQEREAAGASGRNWLFFGDQHFRTDFLYQTEWQQLLKRGLLTRLDVAFSRDQAEKVYVQHRLREHGRELYAWLQDGAHLYVCGDAKHMAPDVDAALIEIFCSQGGLSRRRAAEALRELQRAKRYQRDVY